MKTPCAPIGRKPGFRKEELKKSVLKNEKLVGK
jgi:hypothetical protein